MNTLEQATLTDEQRAGFLAAIQADKTIGNVAALRTIGVKGSKRDLKALLDDELEEQARLARGWNIRKVEDTYWGVATNPEHPHYERAAGRLLKAYGGQQFRDHVAIEHGGHVEVESPDVSAAIDRFTTTIRRLTERAQPGGTVRPPDRGAAELPAGEPGG